MSDAAVADARTAGRGRLDTEFQPAGEGVDGRRALQLGLAAIWLLDAVLQYQAFMYSKGFTQMIRGAAAGNPSIIARPIAWNASLVEHHQVLLNTIFASIQLLIGLGIAFRPTVRAALAASIAWAVGVWWFGEGLGGVLNGAASPLSGAPGAVIIYALLAVLLWPADRDTAAPFTAARGVGAHVARVLWLVLWLSLAYFALTPANRAPQALRGMIAGMESGEPGWLSAIDKGAASLVASQGLAASIVLAVALVVIAAGVCLPPPAARATLVLAIVAAVVIWVVGEAFGAILAGAGTDPNSGPLLVLLALAYWPGTAVNRLSPVRQRGSAARLVAARPWQRGSLITDTDVAHLLMAIAMAGMLAANLSTLPDTAWLVIFAVLTVWFAFRVVVDARASGIRALAGGPCAPHLVHCGAMVYMFAALAAPAAAGSGMSGMGGASGAATQTLRYPTLAFVFAVVLIGYSIWDIDQLSGRRYRTAPSRVSPARVAAFVPAMAGASVPSGSTAASAVAVRPLAGGSAGGESGSAARGLLLFPAVRVGSRIAMGVTMSLTLFLII